MKTLESPLDHKEIQPVRSKRDQSWVFFGRNDAEAETPVLWPPHAKSWLIGKDSDGGRDWGQEEKGMTEDEVAGWHQGLDGCEFEWTPGVGDRQGGLACCSSWDRKESDMTERLNWTDWMCQDSFCDLSYSVSWTMFHVFLRTMCILLLLDGMFCTHLLGQFYLTCASSLTFPGWFPLWMSIHCRKLATEIPCKYCIVVYLSLQIC